MTLNTGNLKHYNLATKKGKRSEKAVTQTTEDKKTWILSGGYLSLSLKEQIKGFYF